MSKTRRTKSVENCLVLRRVWRAGLLACVLASLVFSDRLLAQRANPSAQVGPTQTYEGILGVVWGDPHPDFGSGSEIRYTLTLPDGSMLLLQLTGQESEAALYFGKRVLVSGRAVQSRAAPAGAQAAPAIAVDTIALSSVPQAEASAAGVALGTKKVIFLLVKFSDDAAVPHPPAFYTNMTNPDTPPGGEVFPTTLNGFFKKTSYNQFSWIGDVGGVGGVGASGGWLTLPYPKSHYAPCGWSTSCALLTALADDATALGRAQGINFKVYSNINFVLGNDLDCCAWGGGYYSSVDGQSYGATWEPPWGQNVPTYAHEMGHSLGLPHSGWAYYSYDSPWDTMSSVVGVNSVVCGSYFSVNNAGAMNNLSCSEPGDGYIATHKDYLGWIPSANQVVTDTSSSVVVTLEAGSLPLTAAIKSIKVCITGSLCTGATAHYYTVEARVKGLGATSQYDNGIPGDGVVIHDVRLNRPAIGGPCYFNTQSGWAVPIDATPGDYDSVNCNTGGRVYPNYGLYNAQWSPGQTYTNGFSIGVVSRSGSTFVVSVAPQATSPTATTGIATGVTTTTATLNGTANPNGAATNAYLQYGLTAGYGSTTPVQAMGSGFGAVSIGGGSIAGLACNTLYHFRALATNVNGTSMGLDTTFTTIACTPPAVVTGVATSVGVTGATLNGTANPNGFATNANFEYGLTTGYGSTTPVQAMGSGFGAASIGGGAVSPLACNTLYHFRATANNMGGTVVGSDTTFTTSPCAKGDGDGDGKADPTVFRPSTGGWYDLRSSTNYTTSGAHVWGASTDTIVPGDYDGDGKSDPAVFRPSTAGWYVLNSSTNYTTSLSVIWGASTDIPVPGDYDGDGKFDPAVFRPSTGGWYFVKSSTNFTTSGAVIWGASTDTPLPGDYDGDGKADPAVFRPSTGGWYFLKSSTNFTTSGGVIWGASTDIAVPGDYDGDGKIDPAVFRPSTGGWYFLKSSTNFTSSAAAIWGASTDVPVPADYDGDGKTDPAVFRPSTGGWYALKSSTNYAGSFGVVWGISTDTPINKRP